MKSKNLRRPHMMPYVVKRCSSILLCTVAFLCKAQEPYPVAWRFSTVKLGDKTFEVHFRATIEPKRHIYSQDIPPGTAMPTTITFEKNPLIILRGEISEHGKPEQKLEDDILLKYYKGQVEFVQVIKVKADVKTTLNGNINFMVCTDESCLPPADKRFSITLDARK